MKLALLGIFLRNVKQLFVDAFPGKSALSVDTFHRVFKTFKHTGEKKIAGLASVNENRTIWIATFAEQADLNERSVERILRKNGFGSFGWKMHEIFPSNNLVKFNFANDSTFQLLRKLKYSGWHYGVLTAIIICMFNNILF